jgi:hypothetical protein
MGDREIREISSNEKEESPACEKAEGHDSSRRRAERTSHPAEHRTAGVPLFTF